MDGLFTNTEAVKPTYKSVEWYTPEWIFKKLAIDFDLDPCSPHDMESVVPAKTKYTVFDNGLSKPWHDRVWLNPPYGKDTPFWMNRIAEHGNGIALVFSRTDSSWFQNAMRACTSILFFEGRIEFIPGLENQHKKSRSGAGSAMFAFGDECAKAVYRLSDEGFYLQIPRMDSRENPR